MGKEYDGTTSERGIGKVLLPGRCQSSGKMRDFTRAIFRIVEGVENPRIPFRAAELHPERINIRLVSEQGRGIAWDGLVLHCDMVLERKYP